MKIWKWLGWDTKEARTERNYDNNIHGTIRVPYLWSPMIDPPEAMGVTE